MHLVDLTSVEKDGNEIQITVTLNLRLTRYMVKYKGRMINNPYIKL